MLIRSVILSASDTCTAVRMQCGEDLYLAKSRLFGRTLCPACKCREERSLRVTQI